MGWSAFRKAGLTNAAANTALNRMYGMYGLVPQPKRRLPAKSVLRP